MLAATFTNGVLSIGANPAGNGIVITDDPTNPAVRAGRGFSHTYGLHVLPAASYPARLQARLDPTGKAIGVINYGVPGRNSAVLLERLPDYLERVKPDVLLVLAGFNDTWNRDGSDEAMSGRVDVPAGSALKDALKDLLVPDAQDVVEAGGDQGRRVALKDVDFWIGDAHFRVTGEP